jgi:hypothetical protein
MDKKRQQYSLQPITDEQKRRYREDLDKAIAKSMHIISILFDCKIVTLLLQVGQLSVDDNRNGDRGNENEDINPYLFPREQCSNSNDIGNVF